MTLSEWQISQVENRIDESNIGIEELRNDLIDHLCCCIEADMNAGLSFDEALRRAWIQVCPNGAKEIETETLFLLHKTIYLMKKITYLSGLFASVFMIIGSLMRFLHWSNSNSVFAIGILSFVFVFLPLFLSIRFRHSASPAEKAGNLAGIAGAVITGAGVSFKMLHYPGADLLITTGICLLTFVLLPFLFYSAYKKAI
ncbi:hypothetical protein LZZ85_01585 [Terrimonas sp. NA20]|uniref:Uncharacterized protein n=1 Tax=Terrimonas ginsenosidimutans TaxID=2908004 RepID=A0ABS9KKT3_9BACT|nr:hypothetical protein [Terrimonas ginsenosidimutans]MCG2612943.1 hypothetical protein [Terrimonas ginsenosidimutans]